MGQVYLNQNSKTDTIRVQLGLGFTGVDSRGPYNYRYSPSQCESPCDPYVHFGSTDHSDDVGNTIRCNCVIPVSNNVVGDIVKTDSGWNLTNICGGSSFLPHFGSSFGGGVSQLLGYVGKPIYIYIKFIKMTRWLCFTVVPAQTDDNNNLIISPTTLGRLVYNGTNSQGGMSGVDIYTVDSISGNYVNYTGHDINGLIGTCEVECDAPCPGCEIDTDEDTEIMVTLDENVTPDWGDESDGEDSDSDEDCDNCYAKIEDCCNDDIFTTDINDFSSLKSPDTYINPDNGEEERIPYNGNLHISRILEVGFKVFYAYLFKRDCEARKLEKECNKQLKRIADRLDKLEMDNYTEVIVDPQSYTYCGRGKLSIDDMEVIENG